MKIAVNIFPLERKSLTGIEIYTLRLLEGLIKRNMPISAYSYTKVELPIIDNLHSYSYVKGGRKADSVGKLLYNLYSLNRFLGKQDVFHGTFFSLPFGIKTKKKIVTIHDLAFKRFPNYFDRKALLFYKLNLDYSLRKADRIICVSNSCYEDLVQYYPGSIAQKGRVVYNGFDFPIYRNGNEDGTGSKYGRYFLFVGAHHPRKNIENMLAAFSIFSRRNQQAYKIVFTGNVDKKVFEEFFSRNPHLEKSIVCVGYVSNSSLQSLYKHAALLLLPSFYEGFGFTILEAMSYGVPVLTSFTSSCKEIAGYESQYLVDPSSPGDIAEKLQILIKCDVRQKLIVHGHNRVKQFSWDKMVEETIQVYND